MSARTPWWLCAKCGFPNRPRHQANSLNQPMPPLDLSKCEQCGASKDDPDTVDYQPQARG